MSPAHNSPWDLHQQAAPHKRLEPNEVPTLDPHADSADATEDPWIVAPGRTFGEMYRSGELPWPQEPLLQDNDNPDDVVEEYLTLLNCYSRAQHANDLTTMRRIQGELDAAQAAFNNMDAWWKAAALDSLIPHLGPTAEHPPKADHAPSTDQQALPERGRFNGPAPFYRRGRAYVQTLTPAFKLASLGHGEFVSQRPEDADQLLRAVEAHDDLDDLQDFIAGAVHEVHRQLRRLVRKTTPASA